MAIDKAIGIVIAGIGHGDGGRRKGPHPGLDSDPDHSSSSSSPPPSSSATVGAARAGSRVKMLHTSRVCVCPQIKYGPRRPHSRSLVSLPALFLWALLT